MSPFWVANFCSSHQRKRVPGHKKEIIRKLDPPSLQSLRMRRMAATAARRATCASALARSAMVAGKPSWKSGGWFYNLRVVDGFII